MELSNPSTTEKKQKKLTTGITKIETKYVSIHLSGTKHYYSWYRICSHKCRDQWLRLQEMLSVHRECLCSLPFALFMTCKYKRSMKVSRRLYYQIYLHRKLPSISHSNDHGRVLGCNDLQCLIFILLVKILRFRERKREKIHNV